MIESGDNNIQNLYERQILVFCPHFELWVARFLKKYYISFIPHTFLNGHWWTPCNRQLQLWLNAKVNLEINKLESLILLEMKLWTQNGM